MMKVLILSKLYTFKTRIKILIAIWASSDPSSGWALSTVWLTLRVIMTCSPPATSLVRVTSDPSVFTFHPSSLGRLLWFFFSVDTSSSRNLPSSWSLLVAIILVRLVVVVPILGSWLTVSMEKDLVWFITIGLLMTDIDLNSLEPERKKVDPVAMI